MTNKQLAIVKHSWNAMEVTGNQTIPVLFFQRISSIAHEVREANLFSTPEESNEVLDRLEFLIGMPGQPIQGMNAARDRQYDHAADLNRNQYAIVGNALLWILAQGLGQGWNEEVEEAWIAYYAAVARDIIRGAAVYATTGYESRLQH